MHGNKKLRQDHYSNRDEQRNNPFYKNNRLVGNIEEYIRDVK